MVRDRLLKDELGAETVELVFSIPILIFVCFAAVQLCIVLFTSNSLGSQISSASWNINPTELSESSNPNQTVKDAILDSSIAIEPDSLEVTGASVTFETNNEDTPLPSVDKNTSLGITKFSHDQTLARIQADVTYKVPTFISWAGLDSITFTRHIDHTVIANDRMEVS